ncbi:response regulator [Yonghaparkia sp. Root332]|uniref:response regulator n=1 Tax=Yonghaparkia sp. Root332 TaxID=1736516 RepID=UPI0009E9A781|nr:response regulator [Yonghaparkia sp. Root332]
MAPLGGSPATVLVADDDPLVRTVLRMALAGMGASVVEARTTGEVVRFDPDRAVDLVILDLNMPGGPVDESLDALAARPHRPRVLLLSGEDAPAGLDRVDGFARKPIELADFTRIVQSLLAQHPDPPARHDG